MDGPSSCTVQNVDEKGKGLVATRKLSVGDIILTEDPCIVVRSGKKDRIVNKKQKPRTKFV